MKTSKKNYSKQIYSKQLIFLKQAAAQAKPAPANGVSNGNAPATGGILFISSLLFIILYFFIGKSQSNLFFQFPQMQSSHIAVA